MNKQHNATNGAISATHTAFRAKAKLASVLMASFLGFGGVNFAFAKVLATVDGVQITDADFDEIKAQNPNFEFDKLTKEQKQELVNSAVISVLIAKEAQKNKLDSTPEFTQTYNKITKNIKDRLLVDIWQQKEAQNIASKITVTDQEAKAFFDKNSAQFSKPNVTARHILVKTESEAKKVIDELNKTPKNKVEQKFSEIANKQSIDAGNKQVQNGGLIGSLTKEQMVKPFSDAAFAMSVGNYSKSPVKTDFGYHIIYVIDKADKYDFDKIKEGLKQEIGQQKLIEEMQKKVDSLRAKAKVQISL